MNILNEKIKHIKYGDGLITNQDEEFVSIKFQEPYGDKKFQYPESFEKYIKLNNADLEMAVLEELTEKRERIKEEEQQKMKLYEDSLKEKELEKAATKKKKAAARPKKAKK